MKMRKESKESMGNKGNLLNELSIILKHVYFPLE